MRALLLLLLLATPVDAAERRVGIASFDRLRVDGAIEVRVATGTAPAARISGGRDAIEAVEVRLDGRTLIVRPAAGIWNRRADGGDAGGPVVVTLGTTTLAAITSIAGARIIAGAARAERIDLSVSGVGVIVVADAMAADVNATVIGTGGITVAGRTTRARLTVNGPATIDAAALDTGDLTVRLDGSGTITARARYTAQGSSTGPGTIAVAGNPKCLIRAPTGNRTGCGGQ